MIIALILVCSCEGKTAAEDRLERFKYAKEYVEENEKKISLLAMAKGISGEKLKSILIDYYAATEDIEEVTIKDNENVITIISNKFSLPKSIIASLIYNFEYEMLTIDKIYDSETEKYESEVASE